jgi:hypothetical protein
MKDVTLDRFSMKAMGPFFFGQKSVCILKKVLGQSISSLLVPPPHASLVNIQNSKHLSFLVSGSSLRHYSIISQLCSTSSI